MLITPENGQPAFYATVEMADNPTVEGTPLNKASLLTDATAALFGLGTDAVPDDVLEKARSLITAAQNTANSAKNSADSKIAMVTGSYKGTGTAGSSNPNTLTFSSKPKLVIVRRGGDGQSNSGAMFINPYTTGVFDVGDSHVGLSTTWTSNGIKWYSTVENSSIQLNASGKTYYYAAFLT